MVEVTQTMFRRILIYALGAVFLTAGGVRAQQPEVEARIAGLEGNAEYMSLLREDAQLQIREDSIVNAVERMRRQLREDPGKRQQYSQEILQLESRIFEIRNAKGRLIDRINTIEQEWVLASLNGAAQQPAASAEKSPAEAVPDSLKVRNLVDNLYFREHLPAEDYAALRDAQRQEMRAVDYVTLTELAETYAAVQTEAEAMEVFERYNALQGVNRALADSLAATWNSIFDNKSYAYGYLLDKMGEEEVLAREEEALSEASRQLSALQGETASDAVADYFLRKRSSSQSDMALIFSLDIRYLFIVRKSRLVRISKRSMMNPCGLLSERTELESSQLVMSERSVILLSRIINCRAYVLTWYG